MKNYNGTLTMMLKNGKLFSAVAYNDPDSCYQEKETKSADSVWDMYDPMTGTIWIQSFTNPVPANPGAIHIFGAILVIASRLFDTMIKDTVDSMNLVVHELPDDVLKLDKRYLPLNLTHKTPDGKKLEIYISASERDATDMRENVEPDSPWRIRFEASWTSCFRAVDEYENWTKPETPEEAREALIRTGVLNPDGSEKDEIVTR